MTRHVSLVARLTAELARGGLAGPDQPRRGKRGTSRGRGLTTKESTVTEPEPIDLSDEQRRAAMAGLMTRQRQERQEARGDGQTQTFTRDAQAEHFRGVDERLAASQASPDLGVRHRGVLDSIAAKTAALPRVDSSTGEPFPYKEAS